MQYNIAETASVIGVGVKKIRMQEASTSSLTKEDFDKVKDYDKLLFDLKQELVHSSSYQKNFKF